MAFTLRSATTATGQASSFAVSPPVGTASTDAVYVVVYHDANTQISAPSALNAIDTQFGGSTLRVFEFGGSTPVGATWNVGFYQGVSSNTVTNRYAYTMLVFARDAATGSRYPVRTDGLDTAVSSIPHPVTPFVCPSVTPESADDILVSIAGWPRGTTMTAPAGWTEQGEARTGDTSADRSLGVYTKQLAGGAGVLQSGASIVNDNPFGHTNDQIHMLTLAVAGVAPPATWVGDFSTGDLSQYDSAGAIIRADQNGYPGFGPDPRMEVRSDSPPPGYSYYVRMSVHDDDVEPLTVTENPRAQLQTPRYLIPGDTRWIDWWTRFPADFPEGPVGSGWLMFAQLHGPQYSYSPTIQFLVSGGFMLASLREYIAVPGPGPLAWRESSWYTPIRREQWIRFTARFRFAQDSSGYMDLWVDGERQILGEPARLYRTRPWKNVNVDQNAGLEWDINLYREYGLYEEVSVDHGGLTVSDQPPAGVEFTAPQLATRVGNRHVVKVA